MRCDAVQARRRRGWAWLLAGESEEEAGDLSAMSLSISTTPPACLSLSLSSLSLLPESLLSPLAVGEFDSAAS